MASQPTELERYERATRTLEETADRPEVIRKKLEALLRERYGLSSRLDKEDDDA